MDGERWTVNGKGSNAFSNVDRTRRGIRARKRTPYNNSPVHRFYFSPTVMVNGKLAYGTTSGVIE